MTDTFRFFDTIHACPVCGGPILPVLEKPDINRCEHCKLYFRNPRPQQTEIARSYDSGTTYAQWQGQEKSRAAMWERRAALIQKYMPQGKLLDVGTGDGRFLVTCRELGYDVSGTEVSRAGAQYAVSAGFDVRLGQFSDLAFDERSFDIITMWPVLEHVPDPGRVFRNAYSLLRVSGILMLAVRNE